MHRELSDSYHWVQIAVLIGIQLLLLRERAQLTWSKCHLSKQRFLLNRFGPWSVIQHDFTQESEKTLPQIRNPDLWRPLLICIACNQKIQISETCAKQEKKQNKKKAVAKHLQISKYKKKPKTNQFFPTSKGLKPKVAQILGSMVETRFHERPHHRGHRDVAAGATDLTGKMGDVHLSNESKGPLAIYWIWVFPKIGVPPNHPF